MKSVPLGTQGLTVSALRLGCMTIAGHYAVHPISAVQNEYSAWSREPEALFPTLRELGIGFVAYAPLGRGFFSGAVTSYEELGTDDNRRRYPRFKAFEENKPVLNEFVALAKARGCSPDQLALAYVMAKHDAIPIPGTRRVDHLVDDLSAAELALSPADLTAIESIVHASPIVGARYPDVTLLDA